MTDENPTEPHPDPHDGAPDREQSANQELPLLEHGDTEEERRISESIDALAAQAREGGSGDIPTQTALWKAVFSLERWFFIPRGELPDVQPLAVVVDEQPMLLAYTSPERARQSAIELGISQEEAANILAVPSAGMVESAEGYEKVGLKGVLFDYGYSGFYAPLAQLAPIRAHSLAS